MIGLRGITSVKALIQIIKHEGVAIDWVKLRHGRRQEAHREQAFLNRWQRSRDEVKKGDVAKMPLHPSARTEYLKFLDLTEE